MGSRRAAAVCAPLRNGLLLVLRAPHGQLGAGALVRVQALAAGLRALCHGGTEVEEAVAHDKAHDDHRKELDLVCHGDQHEQVAGSDLGGVQEEHQGDPERGPVGRGAHLGPPEADEALDTEAHQQGADAGKGELDPVVEHPSLEQVGDAAPCWRDHLEAKHPHGRRRQVRVADRRLRLHRVWAEEATLKAVGGVSLPVEIVLGPKLIRRRVLANQLVGGAVTVAWDL
mmetsp:Transcript_29132/g.69573  ORF Transcript_29132/g.69573 Transcript_29132/m.69573 type:complete len:228 (+) Transcript_29132:111-794(+)